jgi:hypothetical protein
MCRPRFLVDRKDGKPIIIRLSAILSALVCAGAGLLTLFANGKKSGPNSPRRPGLVI